jgi:hypothetical protein
MREGKAWRGKARVIPNAEHRKTSGTNYILCAECSDWTKLIAFTCCHGSLIMVDKAAQMAPP